MYPCECIEETQKVIINLLQSQPQSLPSTFHFYSLSSIKTLSSPSSPVSFQSSPNISAPSPFPASIELTIELVINTHAYDELDD